MIVNCVPGAFFVLSRQKPLYSAILAALELPPEHNAHLTCTMSPREAVQIKRYMSPPPLTPEPKEPDTQSQFWDVPRRRSSVVSRHRSPIRTRSFSGTLPGPPRRHSTANEDEVAVAAEGVVDAGRKDDEEKKARVRFTRSSLVPLESDAKSRKEGDGRKELKTKVKEKASDGDERRKKSVQPRRPSQQSRRQSKPQIPTRRCRSPTAESSSRRRRKSVTIVEPERYQSDDENDHDRTASHSPPSTRVHSRSRSLSSASRKATPTSIPIDPIVSLFKLGASDSLNQLFTHYNDLDELESWASTIPPSIDLGTELWKYEMEAARMRRNGSGHCSVVDVKPRTPVRGILVREGYMVEERPTVLDIFVQKKEQHKEELFSSTGEGELGDEADGLWEAEEEGTETDGIVSDLGASSSSDAPTLSDIFTQSEDPLYNLLQQSYSTYSDETPEASSSTTAITETTASTTAATSATLVPQLSFPMTYSPSSVLRSPAPTPILRPWTPSTPLQSGIGLNLGMSMSIPVSPPLPVSSALGHDTRAVSPSPARQAVLMPLYTPVAVQPLTVQPLAVSVPRVFVEDADAGGQVQGSPVSTEEWNGRREGTVLGLEW